MVAADDTPSLYPGGDIDDAARLAQRGFLLRASCGRLSAGSAAPAVPPARAPRPGPTVLAVVGRDCGLGTELTAEVAGTVAELAEQVREIVRCLPPGRAVT
jgi:hypothetical protein